jgi:Family of unknown function (DUF6356)
MNIFTDHPRKQGISYFEHWNFAMGIAWRLLRSVLAFSVHATLPAVSIASPLDLEATSAYLLDRNSYIESTATNPAPASPVRLPKVRRHRAIRRRPEAA